MREMKMFSLFVLSLVALLPLVGCGGDDHGPTAPEMSFTPVVAATPTPAPQSTPVPLPGSSTTEAEACPTGAHVLYNQNGLKVCELDGDVTTGTCPVLSQAVLARGKLVKKFGVINRTSDEYYTKPAIFWDPAVKRCIATSLNPGTGLRVSHSNVKAGEIVILEYEVAIGDDSCGAYQGDDTLRNGKGVVVSTMQNAWYIDRPCPQPTPTPTPNPSPTPTPVPTPSPTPTPGPMCPPPDSVTVDARIVSSTDEQSVVRFSEFNFDGIFMTVTKDGQVTKNVKKGDEFDLTYNNVQGKVSWTFAPVVPGLPETCPPKRGELQLPPVVPHLSCSASPLEGFPGDIITFTAEGGVESDGYKHSTPEGNPPSGDGKVHKTKYGAAGTFNDTVTNGTRRAVCTVKIKDKPATYGVEVTKKANVSACAPTGGLVKVDFSGTVKNTSSVAITAVLTDQVAPSCNGSVALAPGESKPYSCSEKFPSGNHQNVIVAGIQGQNVSDTATAAFTVNECAPPALTCSPSSQTVGVNQPANMSAAGGTGTYSWTAQGGNPPSGSGPNFSVRYGTDGSYVVTVTSGAQSAQCNVKVNKAPTCEEQNPPSFGPNGSVGSVRQVGGTVYVEARWKARNIQGKKAAILWRNGGSKYIKAWDDLNVACSSSFATGVINWESTSSGHLPSNGAKYWLVLWTNNDRSNPTMEAEFEIPKQ
jgi:hypothetical protein